ncbi:MAG: DNRLRE domain-containing protein [Phycisphaerales bacterium]
MGTVAIAMASASARADVLQQVLDETHAEDTLIAYATVAGDQGNLGASTGLYVYEERFVSGQNWYGRSMIKFPLPELPAGAIINSATLSLKLKENPRNQIVATSLHQMLVDWEEMQATWGLAKAGTPWSTPGMAAGVDYQAAAQDTVAVDNSPNVFFDFDITAAVTAWHSGAANYGLAILGENPTPGDAVLNFYSSESFQSFDPDTKPVLTIDYSIGGLVGDLNSDGFVGIADLNIVLGAWNQTVPPGNPLADPSGDNFVGIADLNIVLGNWNAGTPPVDGGAVPEPATFGLMVLGAAGLSRRTVRR